MYLLKDLSEGRVALEFNITTDSLEDLHKIIKEAFPKKGNSAPGGSCCYYFKGANSHYWASSDSSHLPSQKLKDFMQEIVGYKLIKPEYIKAIIEITGMSTSGSNVVNKINYVTNYFANNKPGIFIDQLETAGVLHLWFEPIYKEEYKIGDWVTFDGIMSKKEAVQLAKKHENGFISTEGKYLETTSSYYRKATDEEIQAVTKIMLPNSKYEIVVDDNIAFIDGHMFEKRFWEAAKFINSYNKADVIVGCGAKDSIGSNNQWKLDSETITKVLSKLC